MSENQKELIDIVRENDCPEALAVATAVIINFLKLLESSVEQASVGLQVLG